MAALPKELPESLILDVAARLGAELPQNGIASIQQLWKSKSVGGWGCLNSESGQRLFITYRLRELGCFPVGCQDDSEVGSGCWLHFFDIYSDTRKLTDEEYAEFMRYRRDESTLAATKLWKLLDAHPVNALADRSTYFNRDHIANLPSE